MRIIRRLVIIIGFLFLIWWWQKLSTRDNATDKGSFIEILNHTIPDQDTNLEVTVAKNKMPSPKDDKKIRATSTLYALQDLTLISGIGPKTAEALQDAGVLTCEQLAKMDPDEIRPILIQAGLRSMQVEKWQNEARQLAQK